MFKAKNLVASYVNCFNYRENNSGEKEAEEEEEEQRRSGRNQ